MGEDGQPFPPSLLSRAPVVVLAVAVLSLAVAQLPDRVATGGLDSSWASVLRYAHRHGFAFGSDVVFTYGPLGFATTAAYSGDPIQAASWACFAITVLFVVPIVLVARRLPWRQAAGLLVLLGGLPLVAAGMLDAAVQAGLMCWGILAFTSRADEPLAARAARGLAFACFVGLVGLAKFSWLVAGGLTLAAVAAADILRGRRADALAVVVASAAAFLGGWLALGQPLAGLPAFLAGSLELAAGYAHAMGTRGKTDILLLAATVAGLCVAGIVVRCRSAALPGEKNLLARRVLLAGWLGALLFLGWKHGLVRAANGDAHVGALLGQCVVLAFAIGAVPLVEEGRDRLALARGWIVTVLVLAVAVSLKLGSLEDGIAAGLKRISTNARILFRPERHRRFLDVGWNATRANLALPAAAALVGDEPVDVFGCRQDFAIANGMNYSPRPVFQSYAAYTPRLAMINDEFLRSPRAPDWLLFECLAIDGRYPPLEDSHALRTILRDYRLAGEDGDFLVLRRRQRVPVRLETISSGTLEPGVRLDLSPYADGDLWLEIDASMGLVAKAESFLLRAPTLRIRVWPEGGPADGEVYNAPAPLLAAGFIASPVLTDTDAVAAFLADGTARRLEAIAVEPASRYRSQTTIRYRLARIEEGLRGPFKSQPIAVNRTHQR